MKWKILNFKSSNDATLTLRTLHYMENKINWCKNKFYWIKKFLHFLTTIYSDWIVWLKIGFLCIAGTVEAISINAVGSTLRICVCVLLCLCYFHAYSFKAARFIKCSARSCRMCAFSNSMTSVTKLNLERRPVEIAGSDVVQHLTAGTVSKEENSLWKMTFPPTRDQICWFFWGK